HVWISDRLRAVSYMIYTKEQQRLSMLRQYLRLQHCGNVLVAIHEWPEVGKSMHLTPINRRIAREHAQLLLRWQFFIDTTYQWEKLFVKRRETAVRLRGVAPNLPCFRKRHVSTSDVAIEQLLVE